MNGMEESVEDIVIVGAGIAGLSTALGLHRLGIRTLVLETSDSLRAAGYALTTWNNAWKALDALGIADSLRRRHHRLAGNLTFSAVSGLRTSDLLFAPHGREQEARTVMRKSILEALAMDLPKGTIRYSSKLVSIEESQSGFLKLLHLADGTLLKTKVLIGCDGVNSVVAKWLDLKKPAWSGRNATRGIVTYEDGHGFDNKFMWFFSKGLRFGIMPCNANTVYWFSTWHPSKQEELEENPLRMKQFILSKLGKVPSQMRAVVENTEADSFVSLPLRYRPPWELIWNNFSRGNVCVAGDALHPMTPDLGQGGCSALEDGVVLARCLGEAMSRVSNGKVVDEKEEYKRIEKGLEKYAKERRWRSIKLITASYVVGSIQESEWKVMNYLRDKILADFLVGLLIKAARKAPIAALGFRVQCNKKLRLDSENSIADAESIVSKAIRDEAIDATIDHSNGWMVSKETGDIYSTNEPQIAFNSRIAFCLNMHNEAVRALRFPPNSRNEKESAEKRRERQQQEQELAKHIAEEDDDDF